MGVKITSDQNNINKTTIRDHFTNTVNNISSWERFEEMEASSPTLLVPQRR